MGEKNNGILRQQKQITEENLKSLVKDLEGAKNLSSEMKQIKGVLENMNSGDNQENNLNAPNKEESVTDIENKIRGTRKVYKELKNFLGEFLTRIDPLQRADLPEGIWEICYKPSGTTFKMAMRNDIPKCLF